MTRCIPATDGMTTAKRGPCGTGAPVCLPDAVSSRKERRNSEGGSASNTVLSFDTCPDTSTCSARAGVAQASHEGGTSTQDMNDTSNAARKVVEELERCAEEESDGNDGCRQGTRVLHLRERRARTHANKCKNGKLTRSHDDPSIGKAKIGGSPSKSRPRARSGKADSPTERPVRSGDWKKCYDAYRTTRTTSVRSVRR